MGRRGVLTQPQLTPADVEYITEDFVPLDELCRRHGDDRQRVRRDIERGRLPHPTYVLDDGTEMVPADYFDLVDEAGGVERLREHFVASFAAAGGPADDADAEWSAYLTGEYGACLREVTPANIARKTELVERIEALVDAPQPHSTRWGDELRAAVDQLDALERDFAPYDRVRFGGPVSRDRLITAVREQYAAVFAREPGSVVVQ